MLTIINDIFHFKDPISPIYALIFYAFYELREPNY